MLKFFSDYLVFVQSHSPADYNTISNIHFLNSTFSVNKTNFKSIPDNSVVILDDFSFSSNKRFEKKIEFLEVINYILRHHNITLFLLVHNLYNTNLATEILLAPHIFLSYTNLGESILR